MGCVCVCAASATNVGKSLRMFKRYCCSFIPHAISRGPKPWNRWPHPKQGLPTYLGLSLKTLICLVVSTVNSHPGFLTMVEEITQFYQVPQFHHGGFAVSPLIPLRHLNDASNMWRTDGEGSWEICSPTTKDSHGNIVDDWDRHTKRKRLSSCNIIKSCRDWAVPPCSLRM